MDGMEQVDNSATAVAAILQAAQEFGGFLSHDISSTHQEHHSTAVLAVTEEAQVADNPDGLARISSDTIQIQVQMGGEVTPALDQTEQPVPPPHHTLEILKEMRNTETQSLTWGELTLEMLSDIVSQQVITVSPIEGFFHGHGPPCLHMKGIKWKELVDTIINTHNAVCKPTGVLFSHNNVQVGVMLESNLNAQGMLPIYSGSKKVDAGTQTSPDLVLKTDENFKKKQANVTVEVADVETQTLSLTDEDSGAQSSHERNNQERTGNEILASNTESMSNQGSIGYDIKSARNNDESQSPNKVEKIVAYQGTIGGDRVTENDKMTTTTAEEPSSKVSENSSDNTVKEDDFEIDIPVKGFPAQCPVCKKRFRSSSILRRHSKVHEENHNRHPCKYCDKVCKTQCYLERHMATHLKPEKRPIRKRKANKMPNQVRKTVKQEIKKPSQCQICMKTFTIPRNLTRHEKIHQRNDRHPCPHCDKVCRSVHYLQMHMMVHAEEKQHKCPECGISFGAKHKLKQHRTKEHNVFEQHVCNVCGMIYKHKETLEDHMLEHNSKTSYLCDLCGKTFSRPSVYRLHLAYHASRATPEAHPCSNCPKSYATKGLLNKHIRSAHVKERNHKCSLCGTGFFTKQQCLSHEQVHSASPAHLCTFCGKGFAQKHTLIAHRRMHTGYRPFVCQHCNKGFTSKPHLVKHEKIHTSTEQPERPFQCKVCSSTFTNKTAWTDHEKRHAGIKDHKCHFCFVAFVTRGDLIRHLKTHTGGKPFKCQHCDLRFSKKIELTEHEASHAVVEVPITVTLLPVQ